MSETSFQAPDLAEIAKLLPQYDFQAFIAQGGMGAVYLAVQRGLDREVAIKVLPGELGADAEFHASFAAEAKAMARLNHPNLIGVYDFGEANGMPYIVMEFVRGESLYHASFDSRIDPVQAATIVKGICDGLAHAHAQGIIHRDIKPANVLLNLEAQPKIGDFGLARPAGKDESGVVMGTPGYVAPEVLNRPDLADKRSDLFAVGVILYELVTGLRAPFAKTPPPPASTICGCDIALDRICDKAMNPMAALRYQTADELSTDLAGWLAKHNKPASAAAVIGASGSRRTGPPAPRRTAYRRTAKSSSGGGIGWLLGLAALGALGFFLWKQNSQEPAKPAAHGTTETVVPHEPKKSADELAGEAAREQPDSPFGKARSGTATNADPGEGSLFGTHLNSDGQTGHVEPGIPTRPRNGTTRVKPADDTAPAGPVPAEVGELEGKAKVLVANLISERDQSLVENAKDFTWGLDSALRNLSSGEQDRLSSTVANLKSQVTGNRVPSGAAEDLESNDRMAKLATSCADKQKRIDEDFSAKAERIRSSYVERMKKLADTPDKNVTAFAVHRARAAADLDSWISGMGFNIFRDE